ncbi:MAG: pyrroline-5-carboxylate reductase [Acidobacteria bacterium]|nr:pyrroline-5-carboxylate reductase [Acidobacteriota bacterium]
MAFDLVIVGGGRMGSALATGLVSAHWCEPEKIVIVEHDAFTRYVLGQDLPGVSVVASLELEHVGPSTGAVLAVKPEHAESVARLVGACGVTRVMSVVAGLSTDRLSAVLPHGVAVVRAMPNTPVLVGRGVSAISGGVTATSDDLEWASSILGAVGSVVRVSERHMDAVTGVSGCGPAFIYLVAESLIEAGVHQGLPREMSRELVVGTLMGAAEMLSVTASSPEELRSQVTSPGGATAAGLRMLESRAVRAAFLEAVSASAERSRQLGR